MNMTHLIIIKTIKKKSSVSGEESVLKQPSLDSRTKYLFNLILLIKLDLAKEKAERLV